VDLRSLTHETFAPLTGQAFTLPLDGGTLTLTLRGVEVLADGAAAPERRTPFALHFRGPERPLLPQRIYPLEHPSLGTIELFLVPIGGAGGAVYEAVFG
jgi:hypothetical protein